MSVIDSEKKAALLRALEYCEDFIDRHHKIQKMNEMQLDQHRQECMRLGNQRTCVILSRYRVQNAK